MEAGVARGGLVVIQAWQQSPAGESVMKYRYEGRQWLPECTWRTLGSNVRECGGTSVMKDCMPGFIYMLGKRVLGEEVR